MSVRRSIVGAAIAALTIACGVREARPDAAGEPPTWAEVQPGSFRMGAPAQESCRRDEPPARQVTVTAAFEVAPFEVTQSEFADAMGYNPAFATQAADYPVDSVSWHEAAAYTVARSTLEHLTPCYACTGTQGGTACQRTPDCNGYRLPTEVEWEYAARAGTRGGTYAGAITSCMSYDGIADLIGWFKSNSGGESQPVGGKEPNAWGLFDTAGNLAEWTDDGIDDTTQRLKGGSWYHNPHQLRAAARLHAPRDARLSYAGFRLVRTLDRTSPGLAASAG